MIERRHNRAGGAPRLAILNDHQRQSVRRRLVRLNDVEIQHKVQEYGARPWFCATQRDGTGNVAQHITRRLQDVTRLRLAVDPGCIQNTLL